MKKRLLAAIIAGTLLAGCTTTQQTATEQVQIQGNKLKQKRYQVSMVENVELVRLKIHTSFGVAEGIFSSYLDKVKASPAYHQYFNATNGKSIEQVQAIRDELKTQGKLVEIEAFENTNKVLILKSIELVKTFKQQVTALSDINTGEAFAKLGFKEKIVEGLKVQETFDEVDYIKSSTAQIIRLSAISSASQLLF
jgi:MFS superfamily sulfate permease-like transporter